MSHPPQHHRLALFSLRPLNQNAQKVAIDPRNSHLLSYLANGHHLIDIGHTLSFTGKRILARLGSRGDVIIDNPSIEPHHCEFVIDLRNRVYFYDRSERQDIEIIDGVSAGFSETNEPRRVEVMDCVNTRFTMGGFPGGDLRFEIVWHGGPEEIESLIEERKKATLAKNPNPKPRSAEDESDEVDEVDEIDDTPDLGGLSQIRRRNYDDEVQELVDQVKAAEALKKRKVGKASSKTKTKTPSKPKKVSRV